jgi:hypothetical protein
MITVMIYYRVRNNPTHLAWDYGGGIMVVGLVDGCVDSSLQLFGEVFV